ncbi:MAG: hypothetical protein KDD63_21670 [Bacteroidetes bacterium]|nr:hypothetical protein [Bacteroidota bacterium]
MTSSPYKKVPPSPEHFSAANAIAKILDGLGYRYHWASKDLRAIDLAFKTSEGARTTLEVLIHICDLTEGILKVAKQEVIIPPFDFSDLTYPQLREKTLKNLEEASNIFKVRKDEDLEKMNLILESNGKQTSFPLWNVLVGPVTDTGYHIGQVVAFRRASGNPMNPNVNAFLGYTVGV